MQVSLQARRRRRREAGGAHHCHCIADVRLGGPLLDGMPTVVTSSRPICGCCNIEGSQLCLSEPAPAMASSSPTCLMSTNRWLRGSARAAWISRRSASACISISISISSRVCGEQAPSAIAPRGQQPGNPCLSCCTALYKGMAGRKPASDAGRRR